MPRLRLLVLAFALVAIVGALLPCAPARAAGEDATVVVRCKPTEVEKVRGALERLGLGVDIEVYLPTPSEQERTKPTTGGSVPLSDATAAMRDVLRTVAATSTGPGHGAYVESLEVRPQHVRMRVRLSDTDVLEALGKAFTGRAGYEGVPTLTSGPVEASAGGWVADMVLNRALPTGPLEPSREPAAGFDYDALVLLSELLDMRLLRAGRLRMEEAGKVMTVRQRLQFESGSLRTFDRLLTRVAERPGLVVEGIAWTLEDPARSATRIRMSEIHIARRFGRSRAEAPVAD